MTALFVLAGCLASAPAPVTSPPVEPVTVAPPPVVHVVTPLALTEGIALFNKGDFNGAIKRLSAASEIWTADKSVQQEALKYMAFSYCVTGRQVLCKQQFEKAVALDWNFDLAPGEKGHPLWGPVFDRVKKIK